MNDADDRRRQTTHGNDGHSDTCMSDILCKRPIYTFVPKNVRICFKLFVLEFRHSEGSRFEYYADNGRRTRNNAISEPPPPYTAVR